MSHSDDAIEEQQKAERPKIIFTNAFDLLAKLLSAPCTITKEVHRRNIHATYCGFRAHVDFEGQQYEILVNPLHRYSDESNG